MKKILLVLVTLCSSIVFAGQHSGLGGGTSPTSPTPETPTTDSAIDAFNRWIQEQIENAMSQPPPSPQK